METKWYSDIWQLVVAPFKRGIPQIVEHGSCKKGFYATAALALVANWHEDGSGVDETIEALTNVLALLAYQRENVKKAEAPELNFEDEDDE